jgi:hypothetical protein
LQQSLDARGRQDTGRDGVYGLRRQRDQAAMDKTFHYAMDHVAGVVCNSKV